MQRAFILLLAATNVALVIIVAALLYRMPAATLPEIQAGYIADVFRFFARYQKSIPAQPALEYKDFVSILLTAVGLLITVLALFLALAAFWGYQGIKLEAARVAAEVAERVAPPVAARTAETVSRQQSGLRVLEDTDYGRAAAGGENGDGHQGDVAR